MNEAVGGSPESAMTLEEWRAVAEKAIRRIDRLEELANLTHSQHVLRELPEIRDRILGPAVVLTRANVAAVLDLIEAEHRARVPVKDERPHSRACGMRCPGHWLGCACDCPTCHGEVAR